MYDSVSDVGAPFVVIKVLVDPSGGIWLYTRLKDTNIRTTPKHARSLLSG